MYLSQSTLLQGGKYKIVRFISAGGFGCTYEAEHTMLHKRVAIKEFFVKDFCNRDEQTSHVTVGTQTKVALVSKLRKKFVDEAIALSQLRHENIVSVSDVFEENGTAYYVMDFVNGKSIHELLKQRKSLPEATAVKYIRQVAEALRYVHSQNRLHLDIKPGNILIDESDNAILIDFGASKQYDEESGENTSTLLGKTPGYAPIEQMGNSVQTFTPATDIYALGATLYKMLTGITPPESNLLVSDDEALQPLPKSISASTRKAVMQAMQVKKKDRPQTMDELLSLLDAANKGGEPCKADDDSEETLIDVPEEKPVPKPKPTKQQTEKDADKPASHGKALKAVVAAVVVVGALVGWFFFGGTGYSGPNADLYKRLSLKAEEFYSAEDSMSYAFGVALSDGLKEYLATSLGIDTLQNFDDCMRGILDGARGNDESKKIWMDDSDYYTGRNIGEKISSMIDNQNQRITGNDSAEVINKTVVLMGLVDGSYDVSPVYDDYIAAREDFEMIMSTLQEEYLEKVYGYYKRECEEYMERKAREDGVCALPSGVLYKVIKRGYGPTPHELNDVKVHYEGTLIDGTVFDSSLQRGEPCIFRCDKVIKGWTEALTHMPVGSEWMVYIPQELAYGERETGSIKPFSALTFKIQLISIED